MGTPIFGNTYIENWSVSKKIGGFLSLGRDVFSWECVFSLIKQVAIERRVEQVQPNW